MDLLLLASGARGLMVLVLRRPAGQRWSVLDHEGIRVSVAVDVALELSGAIRRCGGSSGAQTSTTMW